MIKGGYVACLIEISLTITLHYLTKEEKITTSNEIEAQVTELMKRLAETKEVESRGGGGGGGGMEVQKTGAVPGQRGVTMRAGEMGGGRESRAREAGR